MNDSVSSHGSFELSKHQPSPTTNATNEINSKISPNLHSLHIPLLNDQHNSYYSQLTVDSEFAVKSTNNDDISGKVVETLPQIRSPKKMDDRMTKMEHYTINDVILTEDQTGIEKIGDYNNSSQNITKNMLIAFLQKYKKTSLIQDGIRII